MGAGASSKSKYRAMEEPISTPTSPTAIDDTAATQIVETEASSKSKYKLVEELLESPSILLDDMQRPDIFSHPPISAPTSPTAIDDKAATQIVETINAEELTQLLQGLLSGSDAMLAAVKSEFLVFLLRLLNGDSIVVAAVRDQLSAVLKQRKEKQKGTEAYLISVSNGSEKHVRVSSEVCERQISAGPESSLEPMISVTAAETEQEKGDTEATTVTTSTLLSVPQTADIQDTDADGSFCDSEPADDVAELERNRQTSTGSLGRRTSNATRNLILDRRLSSTSNIFKGTTAAANFDHTSKRTAYVESIASHHMYAWLGWTPDTESSCYESLHNYFPGALPGPVVHFRLAEILRKEYGFTPDNTLVGLSICPDELNHRKGGLAHQMSDFWGEVFPLGGIGGAPFVGKTGFSAFAGHGPEGGNTLLLFGPHVAISQEGEVGKYLRAGQACLSDACGAVIGAYNACRSVTEDFEEEQIDESDMQMSWLRAQLLPHTERIKVQENPMAALSYQAYEMVKAATDKIVTFSRDKGYTAIVGGVQLNMPSPYVDHFLPLSFNICKAGEVPTELMRAFRCRTNPYGSFSSEGSDSPLPDPRRVTK